jgi:DNA mismatch endonuclease (patch repair protein)
MKKIKSENTQPEIFVRKFLFSRGFRYLLHVKNLPGKPDMVLPKYKSVIFINGCFWHGHDCKLGSGSRIPKSNSQYWKQKIAKNIERDKNNIKKISELGYNVFVIWECEIKDENKLIELLTPLLRLKKIYIDSSKDILV